jgi:hypothetical protein
MQKAEACGRVIHLTLQDASKNFRQHFITHQLPLET